jgi:hypothetical protein
MTISYCKWESYVWKNELATQSDRVAVHFAEAISDDDSLKHNPYHMLDRAIEIFWPVTLPATRLHSSK